MSLLMLPLVLSSSAHAFCGTYVGGAGAELYNNVAEVAIVRQGTQTTLTMSNDIEGNTGDFAMVIPVPEVLPEENVNVLDWQVFERIDTYSEPRLVSYVCEDFARSTTGATTGTGSASTGTGGGGGVDVEAEYVVGEYQIVILSAAQSGALFTWLNDEGYAVPEASRPMLQEYIDAGSFFLAAKVAPEAGIASGDILSPLQLRYESEAFAIPIRLGTLNAKETQDLIVYALNGYAEGRVGISNYDEVEIDDECMWESEGESFPQFYADRFARAYADTDGPVWVTEYAWGGNGCDPCTGTPPDDQDLVSLGYDPSLAGGWRTIFDVYFTRLHMRYAPHEATQDVVLYHSNQVLQDQQRYIRHLSELESRFPVCDEGMRDEPGTCDTGHSVEGKGCGCGNKSALPIGVGFLGLLGLGVLHRRRES